MDEDSRGQVVALLREIAKGRPRAKDDLCQLVYEDLKNVAQRLMRGERAGHTLQPTALVNEALIRLLGDDLCATAANRAVFYGAAAQAMQRVLVDHARRRNALKRAGRWRQTPLDNAVDAFEEENIDLVELDRAMEELREVNQRQFNVVTLKFFGGVAVKKIAEMMGVSQSTVEKDLQRARLFLAGELEK
jgi:RNA polymerase sigma factor (TIGR02999 family)